MVRAPLACLVLLDAFALFAQARPAQKPYQPVPGQLGKDVVWVPTSKAMVEKMLDMAQVGAQDYLIDLGSGDGRTVIAAARRGAQALGIEYNPELVELSRRNAASAGLSERAAFVQADLFESDLEPATVITMFLLPEINLRLRPKLLGLKPGTRIVSNSFTMDDWQPDERATVTGTCKGWCTALFWIVPAKVEGNWRMPEGRLTLKQQFQMVSGTLNGAALSDGRLKGDAIEFSVGATQYAGRVHGDVMQGRTAGSSSAWNATRVRSY